MYDMTVLEKGCENLGISLDENQKEQFIKFYEYLVEKNKVMNLTGITDSLKKRVTFLEETFNLLGFDKITAIHGRAEEFAKNKAYREQYDLCVSRAVSNLSTLSEYCLPYVKKGGVFISYKSGKVQEEAEGAAKAIKLLGGEIKDICYFTLPDSEIERSLVVIEKVKNTPGKYPRKAGTPLKEPL